MSRRITIAVLAVLATLWSGLTAQTLTVADGNNAIDRYIPIYGYYMDAPQKSHVLYPAGMLSSISGTYITGLTYYFSTAPSGAWGGTQMVRMGITNSSNLQNGYDSAAVTTVWTGTLSSHISGNTLSITLDEPFPYSGGNLLIEVENPTGVAWKDAYFAGESQNDQLSYMTYTYGGAATPHGAAFLPQTTFAYEVGCLTPRHATVDDVTDESALLFWTAPQFTPVASYTVAYKKIYDTVFTEVTVTDTFLTLTGLQLATTYEWRVRANCGSDGSSNWNNGGTFTTDIAIAQIPYYCGFEEESERNCWQFVNGTGVNKWCFGTAVHTEGNAALYISNDNGEHNHMSTGGFSVWAYRDIYIDSTLSDVILSFDYRNANVSANSAKVFIGAPATPSGNTAPQNAVQLGGSLSTSVLEWKTANLLIDSTQRGMLRLYFLFNHSSSSYNSDNQPFAIDNLSIVSTHCASPYALKVASMDSTVALLTWRQPLAGNPGSYTVAYKQENAQDFTIVSTTDTFLLLNGLQYSTPYIWKVRGHCSPTELSDWSAEKSFLSAPIIPLLPYCCNFEDAIENAQWRFISIDSNSQWAVGQAINNGGASSMYISGDNGLTNTSSHPNEYLSYALAYRDVYFPPSSSEYMISMDVKMSDCEYTALTLWASEPTTDMSIINFDGRPTGAEAVRYFNNYPTDTLWQHYDLIVDSTFAGLQRLYFQWYEYGTSYSCNGTAAVDNFCVSATNCGRPSALNLLTVTDTLAELVWQPFNNQTADSYTVAYRKEADAVFTEVIVTDTICVITGLQPNTPYVWKVRANCSGSESSYWSNEGYFYTEQLHVELPYFCDFEDSVENSNWLLGYEWNLNQAHIGNAVAYSGEKSIYITDDGGLSNSYTPHQGEPVVSRDIYFTPGFSKYQIDFDCKGGGDMQGYMRVLLGSNAVSGYLSEAPFWTHHSITVDSTFAGLQQLRIEFTFYTSLNPAGAIDNISIKGINHTIPGQLSTTDITSHSARLTWQSDTIEMPQAYLLAYRAEEDSTYTETLLSASDTGFQLSNLTASSWYVWKLKAQFANNEWSEWSSEKAFKTLASIPYFCDFEDSLENNNWTIRNGENCEINNYGGGSFNYDYQNRWFIGTLANVTDNTLLYISSDDGVSNTYDMQRYSFVWAYRDIYLEPGYAQYQLSLDFKGVGQDGQDYVKLFLDTPATPPVEYYNVTIPFTQIGEDLNLTDQWVHKSFTVDSTHAGAQRLYILWNNNSNSGTNPPAAIDNISINVATCGVPANLMAEAQDTTTILTWSPVNIGAPLSYTLAYRKLTDSAFVELSVQDTVQALSSLAPKTTYVWKVRSNCSENEQSEWSSDMFFTTTQMLGQLPYVCAFDSLAENDHWTLVNGETENQWVIGNAIGFGDNHALYISNDGGTTNAYTITETASVWAYRDVFFDNGYTEYQLSFDFKGIGQGNNDYMKVFVGSPVVPSGSVTPAGAVQLGTTLSSVNDWAHYTFTLDSSYTGIQRIYFLWVNNNSIGVQPPAAVDNLTVVGSDCAIPSELVLTGMTDHTVALAWTPTSDNPVSYTVSVRQAGSTATSEYTTTDTFLTVSGLTPSAAYFCKVRANCSANDHSGWSSDLSVQMPAALPYICDFEDANERNAWQFVNGTYNNQWYIGNAVSLSGDYSLYISNNGGVTYAYSFPYNSSYVWAYRDIYFDPSDSVYTLSFDMRGVGGTSYQISAYTNVYIGSPATPNGTATPAGATELGTSLCGMSAWTTKTYTLNHTYAGLQRLYFLWRNTGWTVSNPPAAIDNLTIDGTPCTDVPYELTAQAMDTLANLLWSMHNGSAESYTVAYKLQYDTAFTYINVPDEHLTIGNLTPLTTYVWKVRANCTATDHSSWSNESTFQTTANTARVPYICDFEDAEENSRWTFVNGSYANKWYIGNAVNNGGDSSLYVSNDNGATNTYTFNYSMIWAYRDIYLDPSYSDFVISFDCRAFGELYNNNPVDYAKVFLGPPVTPPVSSSTSVVIPQGATQMGDVIYLDSTWHNVSVNLDSTFAGMQRLYILWRSDVSMGTNPPAAFDNISITPEGCGIPRHLTANQVTENDAVLSWTAVYQADSYTVAYRRQSDSTYSYVTANSNQVTLTNLQPKTNYIAKVRTNCDTMQGVWSDEFQFSTTTLPYFCGFEEADENACWILDEGMNNHKWYIGHAVHYEGDTALYVSNNNGVSNTFSDNVNAQTWAYRDIYFDPQYSEYLMEFDIRSYGYPGASVDYVRVFLGPPATPSGNYTPANAEIIGDFYGMTNWNHSRFVVNGSHAGMQRLYFLWTQQIVGTNNNLPGAVDNISIVGSPCSIPTELIVSDLADNAAMVSWSPGACGITNDYTVGYRMSSDTGWYELSTTDTFLLLQNLQSSTQYTWRVRKSCVPSFASQWSDVSTFFTEATEAQLPYFCGFEESDENRDWRLLNVGDNRWYIGQAAQQTGQYALYVSNDNGATNTYDVYGSMSNSWAYRDIYFTPGYSEYQIAFDFRGLGNPGNDITRVFLGTPVAVEANATYTITIPSELEELGTGLNNDANWTSHSFTVDSTHTGHQRLYFLWSNDFYTGTNPPGAVDNIMIYGGSCAAPHTLTVTATSTTSISISFTPADTSDQNWEAVIVEDGQTLDTTQIVALTNIAYTFNNLHKDRLYTIYVRTDCGDSQSAWSSTSQRTDCGTITDIPYLESFDTYGTGSNLDGYSAFPRCWSRLYSSYIVAPYPFIFQNGFSAPGSLYFQASNGHNVAITPEFDPTIPLNTLQASFKFKANTTAPNSFLVVGVMTDPNEYATFTAIDTVFPNAIAPMSWIDRTVSLASYTGNGHYLAFAQENSSNPLTPVSMDDLIVEYLSDCPLPTNVTAQPITSDSVLVDWQPGGSETSWRVVVVPTGDAPATGTPVQTGTHPIVIGGLNNNTMYDVFVQSDCGIQTSSWGTPATFLSNCAPIVDLPYTENFDDYAWLNTWIVRPDCWIFPVTYVDCPRIEWNTYGMYGMESKALLFHSDTLPATAVTQSFGVDVHSLRAQFRLSADHEYIAGCMEVGVMSDPYDLSTFESVQVFSIAQHDTWQDVTVDFRNTAMTGTGKYIAFRQVGCHSPNMSMWIDNLIVYQTDECDAPANLIAYDLTPTSATISFTPSQSASSQWEYAVCEQGVSPDVQTPTAISNSTFSLNNLISGQTYSVYVRTVCGNNTHSDWSQPLTITMDCGIIDQLPYTEHFDTYGTDNETAFPDCWRRILTPASYSYYPIVSSEESASGVGSMLFFANSFSDDWAITSAFAQEIDFDSIQLDFKYFQSTDAVSGWDTLIVGVMSSPYEETSFVPVDTITLQNRGVWESHTVLFDSYHGDGRYVAFRYHCPAYLGKVFIDDVVFSVRNDVGVEDHDLSQLLHLYPNPTNGKCTIRNNQYVMERIEVYDVFGKQLEILQINDYQIDIDLSSHASGIYFVRVTTEQGTVTKRVVKR